MLTKLSQFQAQGWEKWLSRITFTRGTNSLKSLPIGIKSWSALALLSPGSGYSGSQKSEVCPMPYAQSYLIFLRKVIS